MCRKWQQLHTQVEEAVRAHRAQMLAAESGTSLNLSIPNSRAPSPSLPRAVCF
jgi:hypothetical protein